MQIRIPKQAEKISEMDFIRVGLLLTQKQKGKPKFTSPMHAMGYFRLKNHEQSAEFMSKMLEILPGMGWTPVEKWLAKISKLVE
jgi:hypothetical protein